MIFNYTLHISKTVSSDSDGAYVFGQDANSGIITKIGKPQASSACGLPSHLTKPLTYVF